MRCRSKRNDALSVRTYSSRIRPKTASPASGKQPPWTSIFSRKSWRGPRNYRRFDEFTLGDAAFHPHGFLATPPSVTIDINDTPDTSDDITLFDPGGVNTEMVQARVTNNGPEGDFNLQVTPADRATL